MLDWGGPDAEVGARRPGSSGLISSRKKGEDMKKLDRATHRDCRGVHGHHLGSRRLGGTGGGRPGHCAALPGGDVTAVSGSFHNLTITGNDYVASAESLSVRGNLTIAPGACLDAFSLATVNVGGNILVGNGATLALGCSPGALGPPFGQPPCNGMTTTDTVGGNIIANQPLTMYLTADTIGGNVISNGGGPGLGLPFVNFPIKRTTSGAT